MNPGSVLERPESPVEALLEALPLPVEAGPSGGDPNAWCTSRCAQCSNPCSGNAGHKGSHACFQH